MKFSEAMLKGFQMVNGQQARELNYWIGGDSTAPKAVCVCGARHLAVHGDAATYWKDDADDTFRDKFMAAWGVCPHTLNEEIDWQEIYGMAVAAGL